MRGASLKQDAVYDKHLNFWSSFSQKKCALHTVLKGLMLKGLGFSVYESKHFSLISILVNISY